MKLAKALIWLAFPAVWLNHLYMWELLDNTGRNWLILAFFAMNIGLAGMNYAMNRLIEKRGR